MDVHLTERQQKILWATVNYYIETAEPVGSQALAKEYEFSLSPATIRNVMGMLEKVGLLYQPHTSAGRVPSDSGYRHYVNELITPSDHLVFHVQHLLTQQLKPGQTSFESLVRRAAQILATLSGCIALITLPQSTSTPIRHLHFVRVESQRVMVILVMESYETHTVFMNLPNRGQQECEDTEDSLDQELQLLSNFLNHHISGKFLSELSEIDWQELDREFQSFTNSLKQIFEDLSQQTQTAVPSPILVGGLAEFLRQPEFSELAQAQTIIQLLEEEQDQLWPLIYERVDPSTPAVQFPKSSIQIRIGAENTLKPIQNCALVSSVYHRGMLSVGSVGVLGPTRMAYDKVIAFVEGTANFLSTCVSDSA